MSRRYAVVWPEGEPDKAQLASSWLHSFWLQWWIGAKTWWPKPWRAKRITAVYLVPDDPFNELEPSVMAYVIESGLNDID